MKSDDIIGIANIIITVILILAAGILAFPFLFLLRDMGCPPPDERPTSGTVIPE